MHIFQSTRNTRPIIENSFRYIRSDVPTKITETEKDWLLSNNVTTIVDLRTDDERVRKQCPLIDDGRFSYYVCSIAGGDKKPNDKAEGLEWATLGRKDEFVYLDRLNKGESGYVSLYIELDGETQGNAYQETLAKLRMKFAVEKVNDKTITKEIQKEGKDEVIVVTKYVPGMVKTGDNSKLVLFSSLALVSGLGILVYAFVLMKKRREGEE